jgi:glycosyltransferase involved in cell wall biosynthesis
VIDWLRSYRSSYDAILFDNAGEEALAVAQSREFTDKPRIFRFESRRDEIGGTASEATAIEAARRAQLVLASDAPALRKLISAGVDASLISRLPPSNGVRVSRNQADRYGARKVLSDACGDLYVPQHGRVILVPTAMRDREGLETLLRASDPLLERDSSLRIWIIGDGPERGMVYDRLRDMEGYRQVAMPGQFDAQEELFQVADVCVITTVGDGLGYYAPTSWANGIPCLMPDSAESRAAIATRSESGLYSLSNASQLREMLDEALELTRSEARRRMASSSPDGGNGMMSSQELRTWVQSASLRMHPAKSSTDDLSETQAAKPPSRWNPF